MSSDIPDPPEAATWYAFAVEGVMPDSTVVRLTVWTPRDREEAFHTGLEEALKAALLTMYPHCPRPRAGLNLAGLTLMPNLEPAPPLIDPEPPDPNHPRPPGPPRVAPPEQIVIEDKSQPQPFDVPRQPDDPAADDCGDPACRG